MSLSESELDTKLTELLQVMVSRLPADKRISAGVVQQLLRAKYTAVYPEAYIASHEGFIASTLQRLMDARGSSASTPTASQSTPAGTSTVTAAAGSGPSSAAVRPGNSDSDSEDDSDDDDDDEEDDDENDEAEDEEDEEDDEEDEEEESDGSGSSEDDDDEDEPERKRAKQEEEEAFSKAAATTSGGGSDGQGVSVADRCKAMAECLKKLSYRVRLPTSEETLEVYLQSYLIPEFTKHGMDPSKYSKDDVKRYKIKREVELLQQDGASMNLDRRNRAGRGLNNVQLQPSSSSSPQAADKAGAPASTAYTTSKFLDDDE